MGRLQRPPGLARPAGRILIVVATMLAASLRPGAANADNWVKLACVVESKRATATIHYTFNLTKMKVWSTGEDVGLHFNVNGEIVHLSEDGQTYSWNDLPPQDRLSLYDDWALDRSSLTLTDIGGWAGSGTWRGQCHKDNGAQI